MNQPLPHRLRIEIEALRQHCRDLSIRIYPGDTVTHKSLPSLIPRETGTIYNWRREKTAQIPSSKICGRLMYRLEDIARWRLENSGG